MKKLIAAIGLTTLLSVSLYGQGTVSLTPATPPVNIDSNSLSFTNVTIELWAGYAYQSGQTSSSQARIGGYYDLWNGFGPAVEVAEQATGNVVSDMDAYFEYHKRINKIEIGGGIGFGRDFDNRNYHILAAAQFNYNLMQMNSYFVYVGIRDEFSWDFKTADRPDNAILGQTGVAF